MCGVFACFDPSGSLQDDLPIRAILASLAPRGPDGQGFVLLPGCSLVHTRLAIVDEARGQQPMRHPETGLIISYNGEIYNGGELRERLTELGHHFRTETDTEVVLAAFAEYGVGCLGLFEGMFAFALWDPRTRTMIVARDRMGEKPLFHAKLRDGRVLVASEIKALEAAGLHLALDPTALADYLRWKHLPATRSVYKGVKVVGPAEVMTFRGDDVGIVRYWHKPSGHRGRGGRDEAIREVSRRLSDSVRNRLSGDRPIGILLSGGLDSTILGTLAEAEGHELRSYTASYGSDLDEAPRAAKVAAALGFRHTAVKLDVPTPRDLEAVCARQDQPHGDSANLALYLLCQRAASDGVPVLLSGDGADELFWGYEWYDRPYSFVRRLDRMTIFDTLDRKSMLPGVASEYEHDVAAGSSALEKISLFDLDHYLGGQLLTKADSVGMMHGVELRAPFLDHRVIEYALQMPTRLKAQRPAKALLRSVLGELRPELVPSARKQGFGGPLERWLSDREFRAYAQERLSSGAKIRSVMDPSAVNDQIEGAFKRSSKMDAYKIWVLLCLELWMDSRKP